MATMTTMVGGPISREKDDFVLEIEVFPYSDDRVKNKNSKGYKIGDIKFKKNGTGKPMTDFDSVNMFLKQLFSTASQYHENALISGKIKDVSKYEEETKKLFKSDKTHIIFKPTRGGFAKRTKRKGHKLRKTHKSKKTV
jgi:hypothetical protein